MVKYIHNSSSGKSDRCLTVPSGKPFDPELLDECEDSVIEITGKKGYFLLKNIAVLLLSASDRKELRRIAPDRLGDLAVANLVYDLCSLGSEPGVGCTTYANPETGDFCRSLDWALPRNIKDDLWWRPIGKTAAAMESSVVTGILGTHTANAPHFCLGLNQAYPRSQWSSSKVIARLLIAKGRFIPTLIWMRNLIEHLSQNIVGSSEKTAKSGWVANIGLKAAIQQWFQKTPRPLSPFLCCILTRDKKGLLAIRLDYDEDQRMKIISSRSNPIAIANHHPGEQTEDENSEEREELAFRCGPPAFRRYPIRDPEQRALLLSRNLA